MFITSVNIFTMGLWSQLLVSSHPSIQHDVNFVNYGQSKMAWLPCDSQVRSVLKKVIVLQLGVFGVIPNENLWHPPFVSSLPQLLV